MLSSKASWSAHGLQKQLAMARGAIADRGGVKQSSSLDLFASCCPIKMGVFYNTVPVCVRVADCCSMTLSAVVDLPVSPAQ